LLIYALMKKQEGIARYLVDRGANVNAGFEGLPPLFVAIMERYIDLLELGANVNAVDHDGMTLLQHSVYRSTVAVTRDLVRRGARTNVTDQNGATPLMQALVFFRQSPTTDWLESAGGAPALWASEGRSPATRAEQRIVSGEPLAWSACPPFV